jgi:hypothetical protein
VLILNKELLKIIDKCLGYMVKTPYLYVVKGERVREFTNPQTIKNYNMNNTIYTNFAASKMSNNPRFEVVVSFRDFLGKEHNIVCKTRKKLAEANQFLKMFKTESVKINSILSEYPVVMGAFPKKYHSEIKKELASAGFSTVSNFLIK